MGLISTIKSIAGKFSNATTNGKMPRDRVVMFLQGWSGRNVGLDWSSRFEFASHFRGWSYVAISAGGEEAGCLTPQVSRVTDGDEARAEVEKSLHIHKSNPGRQWEIASEYRRKKSKSFKLKRKTLAHLQDSDELESVSRDHPLVRLLRKPNSQDTAWSFTYKLYMNLRLHGAAYVWDCPRKLDNRPAQLWPLNSQFVRDMPAGIDGEDTGRLIGSYEVRPMMGSVAPEQYGMGWFPGVGGTSRVPAEQIIKIAYPSPLSIVDGYSPTGAGGAWEDVSKSIDNSRVASFRHGAFPGVVLELDKEVSAPDEPTLERIMEKFSQKAAGVRNTHKPYVLAPGMKIVPFNGASSLEMDYNESAKSARDSLLALHRTGPTIAGITEQSSFAADTAARAGFYHGVLRPFFMLAGQVLTDHLAPKYEEDLIIWWPDPTPDDPEYQLKKAETMARLKANCPNEIREAFGEEPWPFGGNNPLGGMGEQPLPWNDPDEVEQQMPGTDGDPRQQQPGAEQPAGDDGGVDEMMKQLLGDDGAAEQPDVSPLGKSINRITSNGKARNGHAH